MASNRLIDWSGPVLSGVLDRLLRDMTTGRNILFMTDAYAGFGNGFSVGSAMTGDAVRQADIRTRAEKCAAEKKSRTKSRAEVFTPAWLVNKLLNVLDEEWFGRSPVFNTETEHDWKGLGASVSVAGVDWHEYVRRTYLEVTCGEAPFITRRYDAVTGNMDSGVWKRRIGALDRKLKIVAQQCRGDSDEMIRWGLEALKSCYGYEYQGDNLIIARANVFLTFYEFCRDKAEREPGQDLLGQACDIICWNFWQMDGLENNVPGTGERCAIMDWSRNEATYFDECMLDGGKATPVALPVMDVRDGASDGSKAFLADTDDNEDGGPDGTDSGLEDIGQELCVASSVGLLVNAVDRSTIRDDAYAKGERMAYKLACQYYGTVQGFEAVLDRMGADQAAGLPPAGFLGFVDRLQVKGRVTGAMRSALGSFRDEAYDPMLRLCRDSVELLLRAVLYHQRERGADDMASRDLAVLAGMADWSGLPDGFEAKVKAFVGDLGARDRGGRDFRFLLDIGNADTSPDGQGTDLRAVIADTGRLFGICRKWIFGSMGY